MYYSIDFIEQKREQIQRKAKQWEKEQPQGSYITGMAYGIMFNAWLKRIERKLPPEYRV